VLTVGAGENVVRFLPPLIVSERNRAIGREPGARLHGAIGRSAETGGGDNEQAAASLPDITRCRLAN